MKRRVVSFIIILALCLNLCPAWALAAESTASEPYTEIVTLNKNENRDSPYKVAQPVKLDTAQYTITGTKSTAIVVTGTGKLTLVGTVVSQKGAGVEVQAGGELYIMPGTRITGTTSALSIEEGATVEAFQGSTFFDADGNVLSSDNLASAKTVTVGECTGHGSKTYTHNTGTPSHTWTCDYCGIKEEEPCTFTFDEDGNGTCGLCSNKLTIEVDLGDLSKLVYDGTVKPEEVEVTVTLSDGSNTELVKDTDYSVNIQPITNAGQATVTVTGITFNGTFVKTYTVAQDKPGLSWDTTVKPVPVVIDYDGAPVEASDLPPVKINIQSAIDHLEGYLQYSHKKQDDTAYTDGLPTDAGTYDVIASLPELPNFEGASSDPITLTVNPINPILTAPTATTPTYNRTAQELVTAGELDPVAVADGLEIQFATSETGTYSTAIPTGTDVGDYTVWYKVAGLTGNYTAPAPNPAQITDVKIKRKAITPVVELSEYTYLYDGGYKQPDVTVKDDDNVTVLLNTEYKVEYQNNRNVGTAKVIVTDKAGGNYTLEKVEVEFKITSKTQDTLSITNKPATFTYGDTFTLGTEGGSGNGLVTWEITTGKDTVAVVDANSGQVTITGVGEVTVKATKSGKDPDTNVVNYEDAVAFWTFTTCKAEQDELVIEGKPAVTNYGDNFKLTTSGGSGNGLVTWEITTGKDTVAVVDANSGQVTITGVGEVTVKATKSGKDPDTNVVNYEDASAQWTFTAAPRPVTAEVTVQAKDYDGTIEATVASASIPTVNSTDSVTIDPASITATFDTPHVGTGKTVTLLTHNVKVTGDTAKYAISFPDSVTADITQATTTIDTAPAAIALTYNGQAQALVTEGKTNVGFLVYSLDGTAFSREIPTGTDAGTYTVFYKVDGTTDYTGVAVNAAPISVTIDPKNITPKIELSESSFLYDGAKKEPKITLKDGETVIPESQYTVTWAGPTGQADADLLKAVGTYTATITNVANGNYTFNVTAQVEITPADQTALKITGKPAHVYYGDTVTTLDTTGGTGNGSVKWSVEVGKNIASIEEITGVLTITGVGNVTVRAERAVPNYGTVGDFWNFTVEPKPVMAAVTVTAKVYDGNINAAVASVTVPTINGDTVAIDPTSITATFDDPNVGTGKTVTLDDTNATKADDDGKYTISYPATATGDITAKNVTVTVTLTDHDLKTDTNGQYYEYDGTEKKPSVIATGTDGTYSATLAASDYDVAYADNKNVSTDDKKATVTVKAKAGGNYTFADATANFEIRKAAAGLTSTPQANNLTYTGAPQELVSVGTATGGHIEYKLTSAPTGEPTTSGTFSTSIPKGTRAGTYTVDYKVVGDANHTGNASGQVSVTIQPKTVVSPKITVSGTYTYDGTAKEPGTDVKVEDGGTTIPDTEYTLSYRDNVNAGTATVIVTDNNGGNYTVNGTATFEIGKTAATVGTAPTRKTGLKYNGTAQELITAGSSTDGTLVYSLSETGEYSAAIPTGKAVGEYEIWYKVQGDANHSDSTATALSPKVKIEKNTVANPTIQVTPASVKFTGEKQEPAITVKDDSGLLIDGSEYTVTYTDTANSNNSDLIQVGTYTLKLTAKTGNYDFSSATFTATFTITPADQTALTITGTRERVTYGDTIQLGTTGGIDGGAVTWAVNNNNIADITNGLLTIKGVGSVTVTATSKKTGYADQTATWQFYAEKKPVNALVTAASKTYDGNATAAVTATLQGSDFVGADSFTITLTGCTFEDPNAGTDKKVNVVSTNPTFTVNAGGTDNHENYAITYLATATASIFKADVDETKVTAPEAATGLTYTGLPLALVTAGSVTGGTMEYSVDGANYSASLPTGTNAGDYEIWYRVKGDGNHNDTAGTKLNDQVTITPQNVTDPTIEFNPSGASYDGQEHKPAVTVKDANGRVIPDSEYTVSYSDTDWKSASTATVKHMVTVTGKTDGNYTITEKEQEFTITFAGQTPLSIVGQPGRVQYGDTFTLSAVGGSGTGIVSWNITSNGVATIDQNGLVKVLKSGSATVTATKLADGGYGATEASWTFSAEKRPATAIITAKDKEYDTTDTATLVITWKDGDLLNGDTIDLDSILTGKFNDANAGTGKTVTITGTVPTSDKYAVTFNTTTRASITPKAATLSGSTPTTLTYDGSAHALVTGVTATSGDVAYSTDGDYYTLLAPKETNAGTYPVWYKAQASGNYKDSEPVRLNVTIQPKTVNNPNIELSSDSFEYDGTAKKPDVVVKDGNVVIPASEYTVSYSNNINVGTTAKVTISDNPGGNYTVSGSKTFTIKAGVPTLTAEPQPRENLTYTGRAQALVTAGTAANGKVVYSLEYDGTYSTALPKETNAGVYEVWYKVVSTDGNTETEPESVVAEIQPKPVNPTVTVNLTSDPLPYTGSAQKPGVTVVVEGKTLTQGTDYTVTYSNNTNPGTATVTVTSIGGNYQFSTQTTFEIAKSKAKFLSEPKAVEGLVYTGEELELVTRGASRDGLVLYSLDAFTFSASIPTKVNKGSYTVFAKVQGSSNYEDSDVVTVPVEIGVNIVATPSVSLSASSFPYTGGELKPTVTVTDNSGNVISADEYTVTYSDNVNVGKATVNIKSKAGGNYSFTATETFQIIGADQTPLAITGKKDVVYYGDTLSLGTSGGPGGGAVTWSSSNTGVADIDASSGVIQKIKTSGSVTITATKAASGSYGASTDTWTFYAQPKPVTATVTAANKVYDGDANATLTVTLNGLLPGESVTSVTAQGQFTDPDVGTNKTVTITSLTIPDEVGKLYAISRSGPTTASITPAPAAVTTAPTLAPGPLIYNGGAQALLASGGTAANGNLMYSLDGKDYSYTAPTGTDAKTYTVWYKVEATDDNHKDSAAVKLGTVTISANIDTPTVLCTPATVPYDGRSQTPTVVVRDSGNRIIPESEYTVTLPQNRIAVGTYTVTVTDNLGGNYNFTNPVTGTFEIVSASQNPLSIVTDKSTNVYYGDTFRLSAMGGSGSGAVKWSIEGAAATISANGVVTVTGTGGFTVKAYRAGADGYSDSNTDSVPFVAKPKPVTPVVTAGDKPYDGTTDAALTASWKSGDLVNGDTITLTVSGTFDTADAGTGKRVNITEHTATGTNADKYAITWPDSTKASIYKVDAKLTTAPAAADLTYSGSAQALVTAGITENGIGTVEYATSQNGAYSETIPTGTNAGQYTVWYKVADSVNYTGITPASVEVEIKKAEPHVSTAPTASGSAGQKLSDIAFNPGGATDVDGTFAWESPETVAVAGTAYNVIFTPNDTANYNTVTFTLTPVSTARTVSTSRPTQTTVENGTASTKVSASDGSKLVQEAVVNHSDSIVIQPEITENVTKTEVSILASTVKEINSRTNAALTVSAPVADVTIPNAALASLGSAGGTLDVVTERQEDGTVALTLSAGGKTVENVPGGVTLTVPAEDSKPGTVAMLVHEDGTREVIRKSVAKGGAVNIPLSGSATVVLVNNSMEFTDVPPTDEEAGVIAFASAHQLFTGTSAATFSPDAAMSRGMVATVLHRLEGCPVQDTASAFSDVSSDAWYAGGVAWAASNGIVTGGENGQFNPDEGVTQEQFALMLWRYAGKPDTSAAEAEPAGSEAQKALRWAAEKSVLIDGQDSDGALTRIQAAQMLKNFMENV